MKNIVITLAWLLLAPLAFAQPSSTNKKQTTAECACLLCKHWRSAYD